MEEDGYLEITTYSLLNNKEKGFLQAWENGPQKLSKEMGGKLNAIYFQPDKNRYVITTHWNNMESFNKYDSHENNQKWLLFCNHLCREPISRDTYKIIDEQAA